tara:strand:- start:2954 stop:3346 length:393 start_codon:yes stop_codon:yes gene_type:complete
MLQFTIDQELKDALTSNNVPTNLTVGQKITIIFYIKDTKLDYWYFTMDMFIGDFSDVGTALASGNYIRFDQIPFDKQVFLYNEDGTDKYTLPTSSAVNYGKPIEMIAGPLRMDIMASVPLLKDKVISGGY